MFLEEIIPLTIERKLELKNKIQSILSVKLEENEPEKEMEKFYLYFIVCKILKSIDHYTNYLKTCIEFINNDNFHVNKKYCGFNDTIPGKITEKSSDIYNMEYHFRDYNTFAIDNATKCKSNGYILSNDKINNKWHLYPKNESDKSYSISIKMLKEFIDTMKLYGDEGVDFLNIW